MRVHYRCFLTPACVFGRGLEEGAFPACSGLAPVADVGSYVLVGVEIGGFVMYIFSIFTGVGRKGVGKRRLGGRNT